MLRRYVTGSIRNTTSPSGQALQFVGGAGLQHAGPLHQVGARRHQRGELTQHRAGRLGAQLDHPHLLGAPALGESDAFGGTYVANPVRTRIGQVSELLKPVKQRV
jgi:hypothetical protein